MSTAASSPAPATHSGMFHFGHQGGMQQHPDMQEKQGYIGTTTTTRAPGATAPAQHGWVYNHTHHAQPATTTAYPATTNSVAYGQPIQSTTSMVAYPAQAGTGDHCVMEIKNIKVTGGNLAKKGLDKSDPYVYFYIATPGLFHHHPKGQTTVKKNDLQPEWVGEVVRLDKFDNPQSLSLEVSVYDKDFLKDDKLGSCKKELGPLYSYGHIREKIDNNLFSADVFLEFDYTTTWGQEPPKSSKKKSSKKKKGGCC